MSSAKLKVLAICYEDPEMPLGGMGTHIRELYGAMARLGDVHADLLTIGAGDSPKLYNGFLKYTSDKLVCWKPRRESLVSNLICDIQVLRRILQLAVRGQGWDAVHAHDWPALQVARAVRDAWGIPMVGTMHLSLTHLLSEEVSPSELGSDEYLYIMQQEGHLAADTNRLIATSRAYAAVIKALFMIERPVDVIYNGIDTAWWNPKLGSSEIARASFHLPDREIALYVGRIAEMKGIRYILEAVEKRDTGYCVVLAGEVNATSEEAKENWEITKRIRRLTEKYPDRLRWVGFQTPETLRNLYAAASVGLMPSIHEPFGIVALEHLAMGVPLIATEAEGLGEILIDERGNEYALIVQVGSADEIFFALRYLEDPAKRLLLGASGSIRAKQFTWEVVAIKTAKLYREVIGRDNIGDPDSGAEHHEAQSAGGKLRK